MKGGAAGYLRTPPLPLSRPLVLSGGRDEAARGVDAGRREEVAVIVVVASVTVNEGLSSTSYVAQTELPAETTLLQRPFVQPARRARARPSGRFRVNDPHTNLPSSRRGTRPCICAVSYVGGATL